MHEPIPGDDGKRVSLESMSDAQLMRMRADLELEMKRRRLAFSIGEIGERLVIEHFNNTRRLPTLQVAPTGTKNVDALSRSGDRYSIKVVWKAKKTGTIYPDPKDKDKQLFEQLLIGRLGDDLTLNAIYQFSWEQFRKIRSWDSRMSAWYVACSGKVLKTGHCIAVKREPSGE